MEKRDKVDHILALVKEQLEEYLEFDEMHGGFISPQEMVIASIEAVISQQITRPTYGSPLATVDRSFVQFMLDEENAVPVWSEDDEN